MHVYTRLSFVPVLRDCDWFAAPCSLPPFLPPILWWRRGRGHRGLALPLFFVCVSLRLLSFVPLSTWYTWYAVLLLLCTRHLQCTRHIHTTVYMLTDTRACSVLCPPPPTSTSTCHPPSDATSASLPLLFRSFSFAFSTCALSKLRSSVRLLRLLRSVALLFSQLIVP